MKYTRAAAACTREHETMCMGILFCRRRRRFSRHHQSQTTRRRLMRQESRRVHWPNRLAAAMAFLTLFARSDDKIALDAYRSRGEMKVERESMVILGRRRNLHCNILRNYRSFTSTNRSICTGHYVHSLQVFLFFFAYMSIINICSLLVIFSEERAHTA